MRDKALRNAREEQQELEALHRLDEECVHQQRAGNYLKAFDCMERALVLRRHFFGIESEEVIQACRALAEMCNLLAMSFLQQDNYPVTIDLLKKAEVLTQRHHPVERATTLNNFACYYRRLGKLHSAMTSLKRALELEKRLGNVRNAADTQLNMCAVLSQLGKHQEALEHAQEALISLQEGFIHTDSDNSATSSSRLDRISVMCIAYHNIGVEQEFLKDCAESVVSYKKGVGLAEQYLGADHSITTTIRNSYLAAKRTLASKTRVRPRSASREPKSPTKAGARLLSSPRSGPFRLPSPLAKEKDNGLHIATPRSIIADALSRAPLSALPPLEIQSPPSASKKKNSTQSSEAKNALSPTDPFFSPRFRFDSDTRGSKVKKLTSISPRSDPVVQTPPPSKGKRRKSSVKKPPIAAETGRKTAKSPAEEVPKATATAHHRQTGTVSDQVETKILVADGNEMAEASGPEAGANEPQHAFVELVDEAPEPSEHPVTVLREADRAISMVLASVIDKVAEQEGGPKEQQEERAGFIVKDDVFEEGAAYENHSNYLHLQSQDTPATKYFEDDADVGPLSGELLGPTGEMPDVEQHQHGAVADFSGVDPERSAKADVDEASANPTEESFEGGNEETSLDGTQNDTPGAVVYDMDEESKPDASIEYIAAAEHGEEEATIPDEPYYSPSIEPDCTTSDYVAASGNEGEDPAEAMLEEHSAALEEEDQMNAEYEDQKVVSDQDSEVSANGYEVQDEQYLHVVTEDISSLVEELPLATESYDGEFNDEDYSSAVVNAQSEEVQQWDAVDQQHPAVDQSEFVVASYEQQGYEDVSIPLADEDWTQEGQAEPFAAEDAVEYSSFYQDSPVPLQEEQAPYDVATAEAGEGDPSDTEPIAILQPASHIYY